MPFKLEEFKNQKFEFDSEEISVAGTELAKFFDENDKPVFVVKGFGGPIWDKLDLMAAEWRDAAEAASLAKARMVKADKSEDGIFQKILDAFDFSGKQSWVTFKRSLILQHGVIEPEVDFETARILIENFPEQTLSLSAKISELSGRGAQKKKQ